MNVNSDFEDLLSLLGRHKVKYLLVGGYAVIYYTEPRYTKDIDIWIERNPSNAKRVVAALKEFTGLPNLDENLFLQKDKVIMLGRPPSRIDVLTDIKGSRFSTAWKNSKTITFGRTKVKLIGLADLIRSKRAADRPQDRIDLEHLEKLRR